LGFSLIQVRGNNNDAEASNLAFPFDVILVTFFVKKVVTFGPGGTDCLPLQLDP